MQSQKQLPVCDGDILRAFGENASREIATLITLNLPQRVSDQQSLSGIGFLEPALKVRNGSFRFRGLAQVTDEMAAPVAPNKGLRSQEVPWPEFCA